MGSRIALLREGVIEEIARPEEFRRLRSAEARAFLQGIEEEEASGA
jgi:hypothetical protein